MFSIHVSELTHSTQKSVDRRCGARPWPHQVGGRTTAAENPDSIALARVWGEVGSYEGPAAETADEDTPVHQWIMPSARCSVKFGARIIGISSLVYCMTISARNSSDCGIVKPIDF